jgi:glycosyltransferase involved in cell wall biosynthesis
MPTGDGQRPLRVAFRFTQLEIGGAELRALRLVERLPRERFDVDIISSSGEGALDQQFRDAGARVVYVGTKSLRTASRPKRAAGRLNKLVRYAARARASRYDIVNAWLYPDDVVAALWRPVTRTPIVIAGRFDQLPRNSFGPASSKVDSIVNARVDAIVSNSEVVAAQQRDDHGVDPAKLSVIRNGVEVASPLTAPERRRVRNELGAEDDDVLIGSVGNLRDVKRQSLLIDAFAEVSRSQPRVRLAIIGEGEMRLPLEQQVARLGLGTRVLLPGAKRDVRPLLDAFDIVALSSRSEGLPNALLEGAAAGKPIITTAAGGAVEVVVDGVTGLVVPVDDRAALASGMSHLVADPELRRRYGDAAKTHMQDRFGMDRFVAAWCDLFERMSIAKGLIKA